ncbi:hypothetical protein H6G76_20295 [Nostoc sp. FACHB-152]|uniref:hypothetical protein n=1 Tax=unclassified Nostoc TaxID=2593658 RepID=UPI0016877FDB|nr:MULTISPECIES: hypothetical protein [unclassified Nostoc]MBD2449460.1 hypothetical protein [Nostoc sp. FACHB-152]MBD2470775.1 hypothetical protein [Nostoc sp. FACHB-145]
MILKLLGIGSLLAASLLSAAPVMAQVSYPMTCRGGGTLTISNDGNNGVKIGFQPGRGAIYEGLEPGQCTWSDRSLRPGEPTVICDNGARSAQYVARLVRTDGYMTVDVYNNGQGCMQVTRWVT